MRPRRRPGRRAPGAGAVPNPGAHPGSDRAGTGAGAASLERPGPRLAKGDAVARPAEGTLLEVDDLRTWFETPRGVLRAVDGVSLTLGRGRTVGIVGESGSGKSVFARSVMGLLPRNAIRPSGTGHVRRPRHRRAQGPGRHFWGVEMAMVFQDPMTSLNPVKRVGEQITESLRYHIKVNERLGHDPGARAARSRSASRSPAGACASTRTSCRAACASAS